ncbi:unnamed protein product [Brassica oleracea]
MKKPSSRSQRGSRGIKGKHVLQICVLLGVCIWLIYQVKYSHDKKKEFYETDGKKLSEKEDGLVKLGRKDLLPGYHKNEEEKHVEEEEDEEEKESKIKVENGTHEEEEEEVAEEDEEDKSKLGEEVAEEDEEENKHEEDDIDEQDQSKTAEDADKDDESLEEEKEKKTDHPDEVDMTVDEAREEHYKADDASSAVSHESRILNTEKLKESSDNSRGSAQENNTNATVSEVEEVQKEPVLKLREAVEKTTTEVKDGDSEPSRGETTVNGNSTEAVLDASGFLQNETRIMQERSQEDGSPPSELQTVIKLEQTRNESDPNVTVSANVTNIDPIQDESRNSSSDSSLIENISGSNTTEVKENTRFEGSDDETVEYKESSNQFSTEQKDEVDDTPESTMLQEEREALTDPQTLPDIRIEGNEEDEEVISAE